MMMKRRTFLKFAGAGAIGLPLAAFGCQAGTGALGRPNPEPQDAGEGALDAHVSEPLVADSGPEGFDAGPLDSGSDAAPAADTGAPGLFVIHEAFTVILNDTTCSRHDHSLMVAPASYGDDTPVHYLGGSHEVVFHASELVMLERGMKIPFATVGPGPGHGHCGKAWRDSVGGPDPNMSGACEKAPVAACLFPS